MFISSFYTIFQTIGTFWIREKNPEKYTIYDSSHVHATLNFILAILPTKLQSYNPTAF